MAAGHTFSPLALLGLGYMGGSFALAARARGLVTRVVGFDVDPAAGATAQKRGIVDALAASPEAAVAGAALVVLAGPVASLPGMVQRIAPHVSPDALVMDLGSVKAPVLKAAAESPLAGRFVACHPLAGTEVAGAAHADPGLYLGKPCYLCPGPSTAPRALAAAEAAWRGVGATLLSMDADAHDAFMAGASHLPHVGAFSVAGALRAEVEHLAATIPVACPPTSLRDTTRVAASNPPVWRDIFLENRAHLLPLVRALEERVSALREAIEAGDGARLEALLAEGRAVRRRLVDRE